MYFLIAVVPLLVALPVESDEASKLYPFTTEERGSRYTQEYYRYFKDASGNYISAWHDIPWLANPHKMIYNMVVEIPRYSQAKFEIHRYEDLNPIKQDIKDDKVRFLPNIFPWHGHLCNYGAIPQTWEDPYKEDPWTHMKGDKDPIDLCEIGSEPIESGTVVQVVALGILAMLDGETDWKVIVMNAKEAERLGIKDIGDLKEEKEGIPEHVTQFFRVYKMPSGGPPNEFDFNAQVKDRKFAEEVIAFTHKHWEELVHNTTEHDTINCLNTQQFDSPCNIDQNKAKQIVNSKPSLRNPAVPPPEVDIWHYVPKSSVSKSSISWLTFLLVPIFTFLSNKL